MRRRKIWLVLGSLLLWVAGIVLVVGAVVCPPPLPTPPPAPSRSAIQVAPKALREVVRAEAFVAYLARQWQRPLFDPPPVIPPPPPPKVPTPPPNVTLLGTILKADKTQAMLSLPNGTIVFKQEGDTISDGNLTATLQKIAADHIVLAHDGQETTLSLNAR